MWFSWLRRRRRSKHHTSIVTIMAPMTTPGNRPATKLLPENASDDAVADPSIILMPSRALEAGDVAAAGDELEVPSAVLVVLDEIESCGDAAMVDVGRDDEGAADVETAQTPS